MLRKDSFLSKILVSEREAELRAVGPSFSGLYVLIKIHVNGLYITGMERIFNY